MSERDQSDLRATTTRRFAMLLGKAFHVVCAWPKAVHVRAYLRRRFGRWERVCEHCRSYPGQKQLQLKLAF